MLIAGWSNFEGANQRVHPKRLADGLGVVAANMRLGSADLRPLQSAQTVVTTGGATPLISAYRWGRASPSDVSNWAQWSVDVDVVRSLVASDPSEEIHYTGDGAPKTTNTAIGLPAAPGPASARTLGIPAPGSAMGVPAILVAGSGTNETRVYVDTFVNDLGRESAPGLGVSVTVLGGTTMTLTGLAAIPAGNHGITLRRVYVSTDGGDYLRVAEVLAATATIIDDMTRGAVMQSGGDTSKPAWLVPPTGMKGLISLWNGMLGGFVGKQYTVCVPNKPWAWPAEYQETLPDDIVATGKWLQNWLILTTSQPSLVSGSSPESLSNQPLPFMQSCVSKRSAVSMGNGVCWASPNGLCFVGQSGSSIITDGILTPEQWQALAPSTMVGARWERYYVGFFDNGGAYKGFMIDPANPRGIIFLTQGAKGTFYDPISDRLYLLDSGNTIKRWGAGAAMSAVFKTNVVRHPYPTNPAYGMVVADEPTSVGLVLWAAVLQNDGTTAWEQVYSATVATGIAFSLPGGYLAQDFQAQITTSSPVQVLQLAEEPEDFR